MRPLWLSLFSLLVIGAFARGESLGEIAAREKERRKSGSGGGASYTDSDLRSSGTPTPRPVPTSATATGFGQPKSRSGANESGQGDETRDEPLPTEGSAVDRRKAWEARAKERRAAVAAAEANVQSLQQQVDAKKSLLRPDYERMLVDPELPELEKDLTAAKAKVAEARKAVETLLEEARQQGIPPGWLEP